MNKLKEIRIRHGMTQEYIGECLGVGKSTVSKYENGSIELSQSVIATLCDLFDITSDVLLGRCDEYGLCPHEQFAETTPQFVGVPLLGRVHAGMPILADENIEEYIPNLATEVSRGEYFYMKVEGDCMTGDFIPEGALILVKKQQVVHNNEIAVVRVDDEVVLRHVCFVDNGIVLVPSNPNYQPMIITGGDVEIIGKVCEVRFRV